VIQVLLVYSIDYELVASQLLAVD